VIDVAAKVSTPLALAGIVTAVFSWVAHRILREKADVAIQRMLVRSAFFLSLVAIVLGFVGFVLPFLTSSSASFESSHTDEEEHVRQLQHRVAALRADYESLNRYESVRRDVCEQTALLGEELININEDSLNMAYKILRHEYSCYAFVMAASTSTERTSRIAFADKAILACEAALKRVQEAEFRYNDDVEFRYAVDFTKKDHGTDRTRYLLAMGLAIKGRAEGRNDLKQRVSDILKEVSPTFMARVPPQKTQELSWAYEKRGK
jgi:hypothetical protein